MGFNSGFKGLILNLQKYLRVNEVNDSFQPRKLYIIEKTTIKNEITSNSRRLFISPSGKPLRANMTAYLKSELKAMLFPNVRFDQRKSLQTENKGCLQILKRNEMRWQGNPTKRLLESLPLR
jgi:hypothetical protein